MDDEAWVLPDPWRAGRSFIAEPVGRDGFETFLPSRWRELCVEVPAKEGATTAAARLQFILNTGGGDPAGGPKTTGGNAE